MAGNTLQEWLNRNAYRAFPFEENSNFSCTNGDRLPLGLILDARVCLLGASTEKSVALKRVLVENESVTAWFVYDGAEYAVKGTGNSFGSGEDMSIRVTFCGSEALPDLQGDYVLTDKPKLLASRVLSIPYGIGVDTLTCGDVTSTGVIRVANGHNTELDINENALRLKIKNGIGKGTICVNERSDICDGAVLYYLNGQKADSDGSIWIKGGDGVAVSSGTYRGMPAIFVRTSATINSFMYK